MPVVSNWESPQCDSEAAIQQSTIERFLTYTERIEVAKNGQVNRYMPAPSLPDTFN